jgi:hypothetical protein
MSAITNNEVILAQHAEVIRALGKRVVHDVIEIGRRLTDAKARCGHGNWLPWLEREFGWGEDTALRFMQVAKTFGPNSAHVRDLELPMGGLYLLAAPSTPDEARDEVIERTEAGERLTQGQIKEIVDAKVKSELETKLEAARAEARAAVSAEYNGRVYLTPEQQQAQIDEALAPLEKKIEKYEEKLAKIKERDETRTAKQSKPSLVIPPDLLTEMAFEGHLASIRKLMQDGFTAKKSLGVVTDRAIVARDVKTVASLLADWMADDGKPVLKPNGKAKAAKLSIVKPESDDDLIDAYSDKFPQFRGGEITPDIPAAMREALKTGVEGPALVEQRLAIERNIAEHNAKLEAEHAQPFTLDLEKHYTERIKKRRLREGDCERPWQNYFDFRDAHPDQVKALDATDLAYVGQWTSCAKPIEPTKPKRMTRKQVREMKQRLDEAGKQQQLALRAAWMREQGKRAKDWERLRQDGRNQYHQERNRRYQEVIEATWLAERGRPQPPPCSYTDEDNEYERELTARTPDWCDAIFDKPPSVTEPEPDAVDLSKSDWT